MAVTPTGTLNFGQILKLACRKAGNTQLAVNPNATTPSDAALWLTQLYFDLYTQYEWPFLYTSTTVTIQGTTFALPAAFLKTQDQTSLEIQTVNGQPTNGFVIEVDREELERHANFGTTGQIPQMWSVDRTTGNGIVFPTLTTNAVCLLRYKYLPQPETLNTTGDSLATVLQPFAVPIFPWASYMVQALTVEILSYEFDPRVQQESERREVMLKKILETSFPYGSTSPVVDLDDAIFGSPFSGDIGGEGF